MRRVLLVVLVVVALLVVGAAGGGLYLARRPFPQISGTIRVPGLGDPVEVIRDRWGIPHLFARSERALFFAQGFVHAQDRLWQMELNRRTASGRLSEMFGEAALPTDRFIRTIGLRRAAEAHLGMLSPRSREILKAYSAGVNAYLSLVGSRLPLEFTLLRLRPEPWTPADTLAYGKLMAWVLGGDWREEILRQQLIERFGEGALERLIPPYPPDAPIIVPGAKGTGGGKRKALADAPSVWEATAPGHAARTPSGLGARILRARIPAFLSALGPGGTRGPGLPGVGTLAGASGLSVTAGLGSNNWVVAGDRTEAGSVLLANDPHLEAQAPSVWYLMHLSGGPYDVAGATFPGVPGVIVGHNRDIAWGVTNANPDVQDLVVERFHPNDPMRYLYDGRWIQATVVREAIRVRGRPEPVVEVVRITRNGPILNPVVRGLHATLALRWVALESTTIIEAVEGINRAGSWEEFRGALRSWDAPAQNFVFAHRNGEIGYQLPGRIPVRKTAAGMAGGVPTPGWTGEGDWIGTIPFEALPSRHERSGHISTANNKIAPPAYPHFLGRDWDAGFRATRIDELLAEGGHTIESLKRMQMDVLSLPGRAVVEALRGARVLDPDLRGLFDELLGWDGVLAAGSRPAAVYQAFLDSLIRELFRDPLDEAVFGRYLRQYDNAVQATVALLGDPGSGWWRGSRDRLVEAAMRDAARTLERRMGKNRDRWRWGRLHQPVFVHPIGRMKALSWIFNITPPEVGGDAFTVNNTAFNPEEPFRQMIVASYRQILDPSDWDRSVVVHTTGQSGLPFHRHYKDFAGPWARGEYVPLLFSRQKIEQAAQGRLLLAPK